MADSSNLAVSGDDARTGSRGRRIAARAALAGAGLAALAVGVIWGVRERIASDLIDRELAALGLPAQYRIESIGLGREVLGAVVVGDPAHPDLTIERVDIVLRYGPTGPGLDRITLVRPRIYGRLIDGQAHFGALDRVLYAPTSGPAHLPAWNLALVDARGRIDSAFGPIAFAADGAGALDDGFAGTLGVVVPQARSGACLAARSTLYGTVTTVAGRAHVDGPLRLAGLRCGDMRIAAGRVDLAIASDVALANWTIDGKLALGRIERGKQLALTALGGAAGLRWQIGQGDLSGRVSLDAHGVATPLVKLREVRLDGVVHARQSFSAIDFRGDIDGDSVAQGPAVLAALDRGRAGAAGTPLAPLLNKAAVALTREEPNSRLGGTLGFHADPGGWRVAVPSLTLRGGRGGQTLARVVQFMAIGGDGFVPRLAGNFTTGSPNLPAITGTMTKNDAHGARFHLAMAGYVAGGAGLSVPGLTVAQSDDGSLGFAGTVALSGPVGSGRVDGLVLPIDGALGANGQLAVMRHCATPAFDRLRAGSLDLAHGSLRVCPVGGAVVRVGPAGMRIAAALPALALHGRTGSVPLVLHADAVKIGWPGTSTIDGVAMTMGNGPDADRLRLATVTVADTGGSFSGGDVTLASLPASIGAAAGDWRLDGGRLILSGGSLTLTDRTSPARFAPVGARDVMLTMADGTVTASARLVAPAAGNDLAQVSLRHDLSSGKGHADVTIDRLTFRDANAKTKTVAFQPSDLSDLAKGVIANANGTIRGNARFDWNTAAGANAGVTGTGRFSSDDFDFAAAMGPVEGLSGSIEFTDLVHLVTAPHQQFKIASINPGIEVVNGIVDLDLQIGQVVNLNRAEWPFEGGTIKLEPTELHFGIVEPRRFALAITGLDAGRFLQHINLANLSATGTFDGRVPLAFDANGGRIVGGQLVSRAPGGNVSYVGALTYRDLSPMANYAFRMLRSVDYAAMTIGLEGDLAGEVITKVSFGGIRQGKGAERNLITRQLAALPIRFDVNVRAPFYQLIGSLRSLYDPAMVRDPRDLGLIDAQGRALHHHGSIQPQASGTMP